MKISALFVTGVVALGLATGGTLAKDATDQASFRQIMATMHNVDWTIRELGKVRKVSNVRLVQLDDLMGENEQAFIGAVAAQQGSAQVDALRAAIAGNRQLVAELQRQHLSYRNIVATDIDASGTITVYTFGAWA